MEDEQNINIENEIVEMDVNENGSEIESSSDITSDNSESEVSNPTVINNSYNYYLGEPELQAIHEALVEMQNAQSIQYEHYLAHSSSVEILLTGILIACGLVFGGICVLVFGGGSHAHR